MTSGALPPASVASNFARWVPHVWYWTSTFQPGFWALNWALAAATTSGQPDCASTWSQTVRVFAALPPDAPETPTATTDRAATSAAAAKIRTFIRISRGIWALGQTVDGGVAVPGR